MALPDKGVRFGVLERSEDELAVYDELLARFADAPEPAIRRVVEIAREARTEAERAGS